MTFFNRQKFFRGVLSLTIAVLTLSYQSNVASASEFQEFTLVPQQVVFNQTTVNGVNEVNNMADNGPAIVSESAVVMDMNTGTVVYAKNPTTLHYPASITKILTAILALKLGHLNDVLTASSNAVHQTPDVLYMVPGEKEPLDKLLYGLLLISANDAAVEIAEQYGGSVSNFATLMNQEAEALGATHTHFVNPNGLPDTRHVTTAYDMALISRAAMQIPEFRKIVQTKTYFYQGEHWKSQLYNLNRMLFYYPGAIGVKTGFTDAAHETLVVAATHGKQTFLAVLMDAPTDYEIRHDASSILDYSFAHYKTETFFTKGERVGTLTTTEGQHVPVDLAEPVLATMPSQSSMIVTHHLTLKTVPGNIGKQVTAGYLHLASDGHEVAEVPVVTEHAVKQAVQSNQTRNYVIYAALAFVILTFGLRSRRKRKRRSRRR